MQHASTMRSGKLHSNNASMAKRLLRKYTTHKPSTPKVATPVIQLPIVSSLRQEYMRIMTSRAEHWYQVIAEACTVYNARLTPMPSQDALLQTIRDWIQESNQQMHFSAVALTTEDPEYNTEFQCDSLQTKMFVDKVCPCVLTIAGEQLQDECKLWRMYTWQSLDWANTRGCKEPCTALLTAMIHAEWLLEFAKRSGRPLELNEMRGELLAFRE